LRNSRTRRYRGTPFRNGEPPLRWCSISDWMITLFSLSRDEDYDVRRPPPRAKAKIQFTQKTLFSTNTKACMYVVESRVVVLFRTCSCAKTLSLSLSLSEESRRSFSHKNPLTRQL
jgi:hypothetical protein